MWNVIQQFLTQAYAVPGGGTPSVSNASIVQLLALVIQCYGQDLANPGTATPAAAPNDLWAYALVLLTKTYPQIGGPQATPSNATISQVVTAMLSCYGQDVNAPQAVNNQTANPAATANTPATASKTAA